MVSVATAKRRRSAGGRPPQFQLDTHIFYHLSQALGRRNRALNAELRRFGLDYARWRVLAVLHEHPGCSMLQLADLTSADRTTLVHTVKVMEREHLISREQRATDRRSVALTLTPQGRGQLAAILPTVLTQNRKALAGFTPPDIDDLRRKLTQISENLKP